MIYNPNLSTHVQETLILMLTEAIRSGSIARATWSIIAGQANYFADYFDPKAVNPAGAVVVLDADEDIEILPAGNNGQPGAPRGKIAHPDFTVVKNAPNDHKPDSLSSQLTL